MLHVINVAERQGRPLVAGRVLTFIFGPFLMLRVFWDFFGSIHCFTVMGPILNKIVSKNVQRAGPWPAVDEKTLLV